MAINLQWIGPLEPYESIFTENPIDEIWHLLDFFTAEETIANCNPPVDKMLIPFICESIAQAEEFRHTAIACGEHTRPLLTYYSLHNLTKAVLAIENNRKPAPYHGLMKVELPPDNDFLDVSAFVNDGVFSELLSFKGINVVKGKKFKSDDLLQRCGYLIREYRLAYGNNSIVIIPTMNANIQLTELELHFNVPEEIRQYSLANMFPQVMEYFQFVKEENNLITLRLKDCVPKGRENIGSIQDAIRNSLILSVFNHTRYFMVPSIDVTINWPQEAYLYALSYILASLVRYYPDYWYNNVIGHKRNRWIVRKINSVIERVYPNLMLNIMYNYKLYRFVNSEL